MPLEQQEQTVIERSRFAGDLIEVDFIKFSIDGVPGTTGYLLEPHESDGSNGNSFYNFHDLVADIAKFDAMGLGITFHCMGDAGTRQVLDALQAVRQSQGELKGRHQLGHASLVHPDDLPRLRQLNLTPEFSPVLWYPAPVTLGYGPALGDERLNRLWPMQSLHQAGARIVIATDGPLFWREPMETLEISVTRKEPGDTSGDALGAEESLDLATAIAGMTVNAAYLMNQEDRTGSIETGKFADMIVLDKNLFEIPEYEISTAGVLLTIVGGKVVFDAATDAGSEDSIEDEHGVELDLSGDASPHASEWSRVL
jgi:predicted amidohydrolase YtcJ